MTANNLSKNFIPMANKYDRVILLIDMDCFYCQVEEKLDPSLKNQPLAVVQYNAWRGGGIIAVNYAARAKGVTRHMRGDEAKEQCPEIQLVKVPNVREKADLTKYREAGKDVANVLQKFTPLLERASVDEAYLDITDSVNKRLKEMNDGTFVLQPQELINTYAVGYETIGEFVTTITTSFITDSLPDDNNFDHNVNESDPLRQSNIRLLIGASIASEIRKTVKEETSYECSAGIAHNKILAKLACGINKPNKQTILPAAEIPKYFESLPIGKIKGLGAKFGEEICERLKVQYLGQMLKYTEAELQRKFDEKNGSWLYNICRGIDLEAVTPRFYSKSIGCCKKFPGRNNITGIKTLQHWLNELANEINERLEKDICENNRRAKQMVVSFIQDFDGEEVSSSRSAPLPCYDTEILIKTSLEIIKTNTKQFFRSGSESILNNPIRFLGISVGKFETISNSQNNIQEMFAQQAAKKQKLKTETQTHLDKSETKSDLQIRGELQNNTLRQIPIEKNFKNVSEINSLTKMNCETDNARSLNNEVPKEKNSKNIKSFFLNALNKKSPATENHYDDSSNASLNNSECSLSIQCKTNFIPQNELQTVSGDSFCNKSEIPQKSFFARQLKRKNAENNLNVFQNSETNRTISLELNSEENISHPELQNENSSLNNNKPGEYIRSDVSEPYKIPTNNKRKFVDISSTEEFSKMDYRSQYAEFATPELTTDFLQCTKCSKCGAEIPNDPILVQTHQDHHYAQELSKEQRDTYREEIRSKINSPKPPPKNASNKSSKKVNNSTKKTSADITKFLKPSSSSNLNCLESSTSNMEFCDICKLPIKIEEMLEHKDFHLAKDLQRKINQLDVRTVDVVRKPASDSVRKSMNSPTNTTSQGNKVAAKPITQFFTQSNM